MFTNKAGFIYLLCFLCGPVFGQSANWGQFEYDFDNEKPWLELQAQLPSYPQNDNLLAFSVSPVNTNKFFIDAKSINVGADGVVRYTLVIKAAGGAVNTTFEGIRCDKRMVKQYAYAGTNGVWVKARDPKWNDIVFKEYNRQHHVLYDDFFCPRNIIISTAGEAIHALKYHGMHPRASMDPSAAY